MTRNLFLVFLLGIFTFSFLITDVQAKRFGGGRSFGATRSVSSFSPQNTARAMPSASPASSAGKWLGPLAGLAMGGLLASLFMGHGIGSGIMSWLLVAGIALLAWSFIRSKLQPAQRPIHQATYQAQSDYQRTASSFSQTTRPADFDEGTFLRQSKALFIRLQAAYDNKNLADIREFTSPEVFAEIQLQIQERGNANNVTEVIQIDAELLEVAVESYATIASVVFSGEVREEQNATPVTIKEIWHFHKNKFRDAWIVAGIQQ